MAVTADQIKLYRSELVNDEDTNGGRLGTVLVVSGVKNNIFPDVPDSERTAGSTKYRKVFWKVENPNNEAFQNVHIYMTKPTNGEDWIVFFPGTQIDKQADITGTERLYGCGILSADVSASATELHLTVESAEINSIFQTGDTIWIGDGTHEEFHENVTVSVVDTNVTIQLQSGDQLQYSYAAGSTVVASCYVVPVIQVSYSDVSVTSTSGSFDATKIALDSVGTVEDTWTITFTSDTEFTCSGAAEGDVGTGDVNTDFAPENPDFSGHYFFTIPATAWSGTWQSGDTVVFKTHPAAVPIWFKRVVPAGIGTVYNIFAVTITGESS